MTEATAPELPEETTHTDNAPHVVPTPTTEPVSSLDVVGTNADAQASDTLAAEPTTVLAADTGHREWTLILVRHGETEWNANGRIQGQLDIGLSDAGREQARLLGRRISAACRSILPRPLLPYFGTQPLSIAAQFSSDLSRASETARIVQSMAPHLGPLRLITTTLLRERNFGEWQGLSSEEVHALRAGTSGCPPGGETELQVYQRMRSALDIIATNMENHRSTQSRIALIYGHGGSLRALLCRALGLGPDEMRCFRLENTSISVIQISGHVEDELLHIDTGRLICVNETAHLLTSDAG